MIDIKKDELYLVTGASGFLGVPLCKEIIRRGGKVRGFSRDEGKLFVLQQQIPEIEVYPGDIADKWAVYKACKDVTGIFHAAATKILPWAELHPRDAIKNNIIGSQNLLDATLDVKGIKFILSISTDKSSHVNSAYGATKFLMEKLIHEYEKLNPSVQQRCVKYGNIIGSTSSIHPRFLELISKGKDLTVFSDTATRYFWKIDTAVDLIFECLEKAEDSTPYCPDMKAMKVIDFAKAMLLKYDKEKRCGIKITEMTVGENIHERITPNGKFSNEVEQYTVEEILDLI